jgi:hypothetical protein
VPLSSEPTLPRISARPSDGIVIRDRAGSVLFPRRCDHDPSDLSGHDLEVDVAQGQNGSATPRDLLRPVDS